MAVKTNCIKNGIPYYRIHRKINGKYEDFYGKNKSEAEDLYYQRKKEAEIGVIQTKDITIKILMHKWLFSVKIHEIKDTTLESYEGTFRNHIKPFAFADIPIKKISSIVVQDFYNTLFKQKRTTPTIEDVHKLLHQFFLYCETDGYIGKNPCRKGLVKIPKDKNVDVDAIIEKQKLPFNYFRDDEVPILRDAFKNNKYEKVVDFALGTGMREGEIVGLKWVHLNFEKREIYVKNNTTRAATFNEDGEKTGYKTKDGTPKTESSIDIIPMSDFIYDLLQSLPRDSEYVFTANDHQIDKKDLEKVWRKTMQSLIKELSEKGIQFEYRKFHDLRHTFAVLLLLKGTDLYAIMKLLRHKKLASTEIYLAVLPESKDTSVNKLNYLFQN
jgi:integrase